MRVSQPPLGKPLNKSHPLSKGLVGCYLLNEGGGKVAKDSTQLNTIGDGSLGAGAVFAVKQKGQCASLSGTTSRIDLGAAPSLVGTALTTNCTFSAWINTSTITIGERSIMSTANNGTAFDINRTAAKLNVIWNNVNILTSTASLVIGTWYHVAMIRQGATGSWGSSIYINGVLDSSVSAVATNPATSASNASIGSLSTAFLFNGFINNVMWYNRALSQTEIQQLYISPYSMFK